MPQNSTRSIISAGESLRSEGTPSVHSIAQLYGRQLSSIENRGSSRYNVKHKATGNGEQRQDYDIDTKKSEYLLNLMIARQNELRNELMVKKYRDNIVCAASVVGNDDDDDGRGQRNVKEEDVDCQQHHSGKERIRGDVHSRRREPKVKSKKTVETQVHRQRRRADRELGLDSLGIRENGKESEKPAMKHTKSRKIAAQTTSKERNHRPEIRNERRSRKDSLKRSGKNVSEKYSVKDHINKIEVNSKQSSDYTPTVVASYGSKKTASGASNKLPIHANEKEERNQNYFHEFDDFSPQHRATRGLPVTKLNPYKNYAKSMEEKAAKILKERSKDNAKYHTQKSNSAFSKPARIQTTILEYNEDIAIIKPKAIRPKRAEVRGTLSSFDALSFTFLLYLMIALI